MQAPEDLRTGEWDVQEETDGCVGKSLSDHVGDKHKMVIINPD
jgi:hypothetical protein